MKKLITIILCFLFFSCSNDEVPDIIPTEELNEVTYLDLKTSTTESFRKIYISSDLTKEENGQKYYDFEKLNLPAYFSRVYFESESGTSILNKRTQNSLDEKYENLGFSDDFNDYIYKLNDIDIVNIEELEIELILALRDISEHNSLADEEKFMLTQAFYHTLAVAQSSFDVENEEILRSGKTNKCPENWKEVTKEAVKNGLYGGLGLGLQGIRAGAAATVAAGQPVVGGIVGGVIGFTIGFVSGAAAGGAVELAVQCFEKENIIPKTPLNAYSCSGKTVYSHSASPPVGCSEGCADIKNCNFDRIKTMPLIVDFGQKNISPKVKTLILK